MSKDLSLKININNIFTTIRHINNKIDNYDKSSQNNKQENNILPSIQYKQLNETNLVKVNQAQVNSLLRELINLPKEWQALLMDFAATPKNMPKISILIELLKANPNISFSDIREFLNSNSKNVINKLVKLIPNINQSVKGAEQMQEIISTMNVLIPNEQLKDKNLLQNLLCMYLPFQPIAEYDNDLLGVDDKSQSKNGESLIIMHIITKYIGKFKIDLIEDTDKISIFITYKKINNCMNIDIKKELLKVLSEKNISTELEIKTSEMNGYSVDDRYFYIENLNTASSKILFIVYLLLNQICNFDEKSELFQNRLNKLN